MKHSVLVVDDDDDDFVLLDLLLKQCQFPVTLIQVLNGIQATKVLLDGLQPHLLIVDAFMPLMDGYELLVWVKNAPACQHIPVVIWTGGLSPPDQARYSQAGARSIILKQEALTKIDVFYPHCLSLIEASSPTYNDH